MYYNIRTSEPDILYAHLWVWLCMSYQSKLHTQCWHIPIITHSRRGCPEPKSYCCKLLFMIPAMVAAFSLDLRAKYQNANTQNFNTKYALPNPKLSSMSVIRILSMAFRLDTLPLCSDFSWYKHIFLVGRGSPKGRQLFYTMR